MDKWAEERQQAIREGKFETASLYEKAIKAGRGMKRQVVQRVNVSQSRARAEFEFQDDSGLAELEATVDRLSEQAKHNLRRYWSKKR